MEAVEPRWRKSSYSGNGGDCVEVGQAARAMAVRDTKDRTGPVLRFTPAAWRKFAHRVKHSLGCGNSLTAVRRGGAGESACRPGSVRPLARGGGHPSGTAVADSLVRPTREHRAGRPRSLAQGTVAPLLTLLRVGFTEPPQSPAALVVSYTTVSPLPPLARGRSVFCGTVPRVTPGRRYRPPCPVEPGPSSPGLHPARPPGRLTRAQDTPNATGPE